MEKKNFVDLDAVWKRRCELRAKGYELFAESDKSWSEAILKRYGNIKIELIKRVEEEFKWEEGRYLGKDCDCKLETGELFEWR